MIATAGEAAELRTEEHFHTFRGLLHRAWGTPAVEPEIHLAATAEAARRQLADRPPLLYVYGPVETDSEGRGTLRLADGRVPFETLLAEVDYPPSLVLLHTFGEPAAVRAPPRVPVLVHLHHAQPSYAARRAAGRFWRSVLEQGSDPARAFHELAPGERHGAVWSECERWQIETREVVSKAGRPRSRLDRRSQRERVLTTVRELVEGRRRRLTCIVAFGAQGNLVDHFAGQVIDSLKDWASDLARIHRLDLELPADRGGSGAAGLDAVVIEQRFQRFAGL